MPDEPVPARIGAYDVVRVLGRGGMGSVYQAHRADADFEHVVAIKVIRPGVLSDGMIERFRRERRILARLSHPHIARLYDGGETDEGAPYIVMEMVDGISLSRWLKGGASLDERLNLMVQVCNAVEFAHQNLVIHRDLSPGNILVTKDGEAKLIDFGIARPQHGDESAQPHSPLSRLSLTPGFAAPERVAGAQVTTLIDIYSLGCLLGVMLEGHDDPELDAIARKASNDIPELRYPNAAMIAAEISSYRQGSPVDAFSTAQSYCARKFILRHRIPVSLAALSTVLLFGGLLLLSQSWSEAEASRAEAERRFQDVRSLATTMMFEVYDEVEAVPGTTAARELLASTAQTYLDALAANPTAPADVRLEAGRGLKRLADVVGGPTGGTLGRRKQALANYARADEILSALHADAPGDEQVALALADLRHMRAAVAVHIESNTETGLAYAHSVVALLDRDCSNRDGCALARAQGKVVEGENLQWSERTEEAVEAFNDGLAELATLRPATRATEEGVRLAARLHRHKGEGLYYLDDIEGALRELSTASAILTRAMDSGIGGPGIERDLAIVEWSRGGSLDDAGRASEGARVLDAAYQLMENQVQRDSDDQGSLRLLAVIGGQRALTHANAGRMDSALDGAAEALAIRRRLSAQQPEESGFVRDVAIQLHAFGRIADLAGDRSLACMRYSEAVSQFEELDRRWTMTEFDRNDTYARATAALRAC
nr:serine/threonine-protein kinase [Altererythrobacter sp. KTW20L]